MALLNIQTPHAGPLNNGMTFFALGFRPFFLFAGFAAVVLMGMWLLIYRGVFSAPTYYGAMAWHSHEMLFGYTVAVVAGFLLTAVKNWTGIQTPRYWSLVGLSFLWLSARIMPLLGGWVPGWTIAVVDFSFLPLLSLGLALPLFKSNQANNIPFVFVLFALAVANGLFHLQLLGLTENTLLPGIRLAIGLIVLLLAVMGGRVIPFFIERGLPGVKNHTWSWLEKLAIGSVLLFLPTYLFIPDSKVTIAITFAAAAIHVIRLAGWYHLRIWKVSLLWVLFVGYAWVALGLFLHGMSALGLLNSMLALHAFTVGGIGVLTLGMMARVAIGHTGRMMQAHPLMGVAFGCIVLAAVVRVLLPIFLPQFYLRWIDIAGLLWLLGFIPFVVIYYPMLTRPRVDGQSG